MMKKFLSLVAIAAIALSFAACDDSGVVNPEQETKVEGAFSVDHWGSKKVYFAKGNLQRLAGSFQTPVSPWLFAANQYDTIGQEPMSMFADLFEWNFWNKGDSYFKNWSISDLRNDQGHTWRVLSAEEWLCIFHERKNAKRLFGMGSVNGINGVFILPDNYWDKPANVTFTPSTLYEKDDKADPLHWSKSSEAYSMDDSGDAYFHNTFNLDEWARLEEAGVIFLPAAGGYEHGKPHYVNYGGLYASCTPNLESANDYAYAVTFYGFNAYLYPANGYQDKSSYCAVRLVQDIQPTEAPSSVVARAKEELTEWVNIAIGIRAWLVEKGYIQEYLQDIDDAMTTAEQVNNNANATLEDVEAAIDALNKACTDYYSSYFDIWKAQQISDLDHLADLNPRTAVQNLVNEAKVQINAIEWDFREDDNQIIELRARIKEIVETVKKKVEKL